jgi:F-type H+-transporting ATPase subunit b
MQIDWFTFAAQIVNFLILLGLLAKFLYRPITDAMDAREKRITERLQQAQAEREDAEQEKEEYAEKQHQWEKKKEHLLKEAEAEVEQKRKQMLQQAREEVEKTQRQWEEALEQEQDAFIRQFAEKAGTQTLVMARKILMDLANEDLETHAVQLFLQRLNDTPAQKEPSWLAKLEPDHQTVTIRSSFELSAQQRDQITQSVRQLADQKIEPTFEQDEELGFGIELHTPDWKLAWSLQSYLDDLKERITSTYQNGRSV